MNGLNDSFVESVIKKAIAGKLSTGQAAARLGVSKRYVNKLKKSYAAKGAAAFTHGNKGKSPSWKTDPGIEKTIADLYEEKYSGFNFRHFMEKLREDEGIPIVYRPLHRILAAAGLRSPKGHKAKKGDAKHPPRPRRGPSGNCCKSTPRSTIGSGIRPPKPPSTAP